MILLVEIERETDGRWIAEVTDLPGGLSYGETCEAALASAKALALRALADRVDHGELRGADLAQVRFRLAAP